MRIVSVLGARPQFIKAAPVSVALAESGHEEIVVHTGQHYDFEMSEVFFEELPMPSPDLNLGVGSGGHGEQTGTMLIGLEPVICEESPDWVLIYGDTNSTLAGALAAAKLRIPLAHVEAGLRSYNRDMPEEHNRVLADRCSDRLLCPTRTAVANLEREGLAERASLVGDTMYDVLLASLPAARERSALLDELGVRAGEYCLATVHRAYNTDVPEKLEAILSALGKLGRTVILPLHPRTRDRIERHGTLEAIDGLPDDLRLIEPVGYLDMLMLEANARLILTDSGGVQKEAYLLEVPCVTLRPETEWTETVEHGWNAVVGADHDRILEAASRDRPASEPPPVFGGGDAGRRIVGVLEVDSP